MVRGSVRFLPNQKDCPESEVADRLILRQKQTDDKFEHSEMVEVGVKAFKLIYSFDVVTVGDCKVNIRGTL